MRKFVRVSGGGITIVVTVDDPVEIVHFGRFLTEAEASAVVELLADGVAQTGLDTESPAGFWREASRGHRGRPALSGSRSGRGFSPRLVPHRTEQSDDSMSVWVRDLDACLDGRLDVAVDPRGVVRVSQQLTNAGGEPYAVDELATWLPLPDRARESLDFSGRWLRERQPQRREIAAGLWMREHREGRSGHDGSIVHLAMSHGASWSAGDVWAMGLEWSGSHRTFVERTSVGTTTFGCAELLLPGEVILGPGETYLAPPVVATWSGDGLDGLSSRFHEAIRDRPRHPQRPRPLTLNVWEAVYFDHTLEKLKQLADDAASVGVERFVLDDGWFTGRRDDTAGLGDWTIDSEVWPEGLGSLIEHVTSAGMEFGLWFEGEMLNPDSRLAREHPDWILQVPGRLPPEARHQQVLDLARPEAFAAIHEQIDAIVRRYPLSYIKWDHNRFLVDPGRDGLPVAREQARAAQRMFDQLATDHPGLEIESCASGGGRIDFGMLAHVDRFWASDSNDALERQHIQRWTTLAVPPELVGTHIGPPQSHSSGRRHDLAFRAATALFGHAGIEWDITQSTTEEKAQLTDWARYYKENRALLHTGITVRDDSPDSAMIVHGVVAHDRHRAIFSLVQLATAPGELPARVPLRGLDPNFRYRIREVTPWGAAPRLEKAAPPWTAGIVVTGASLADTGVRPPILFPESAIIVEVERAD